MDTTKGQEDRDRKGRKSTGQEHWRAAQRINCQLYRREKTKGQTETRERRKDPGCRLVQISFCLALRAYPEWTWGAWHPRPRWLCASYGNPRHGGQANRIVR